MYGLDLCSGTIKAALFRYTLDVARQKFLPQKKNMMSQWGQKEEQPHKKPEQLALGIQGWAMGTSSPAFLPLTQLLRESGSEGCGDRSLRA